MAKRTSTVRIREYREADRKTVVRLIEEMQRAMMAFDDLKERTVKPGYGTARLNGILKAISKKKESLYIAEVSGRAVGYVNSHLPEKPSRADILGLREPRKVFGEIDMIYVEPGYRHRGISSGLMGRAEAWLRKNGCNVVIVAYYAKNRKAISLYKKRGYKLGGMHSFKEV